MSQSRKKYFIVWTKLQLSWLKQTNKTQLKQNNKNQNQTKKQTKPNAPQTPQHLKMLSTEQLWQQAVTFATLCKILGEKK